MAGLLRSGLGFLQAQASEAAANMALLQNEPWRKHIREVRLDWHEATGPCRARHLAQCLWSGEEFYLQIDSHMRFAACWDRDLISWLGEAEAKSSHGKVRRWSIADVCDPFGPPFPAPPKRITVLPSLPHQL